MIYILSIIIFLLGVGFHIMQIIRKLRARFPEHGMSSILNLFMKEEWDSLLVSFLVLLSFIMYLVVVEYYQLVLPPWWYKFGVDFILAFVLGYAGQRLAYRYLGTAEKVLEQGADNINLPK